MSPAKKYRIVWDGIFSGIEYTESDPSEDEYDSFYDARKELLEWLRTTRDDYNGIIREIVKLKKEDVDGDD